tara:strand:- start:49 stop:660 length:612 start_codon:yes stop_codon:yes gene_type:complete
MMNNLNIAQDIWKSQYATDFALLDTPQEQIEFLKDLLLKNKENVIEAKKLPQFAPSNLQLTNQINDEFAPHKPTEKEWMKRWDEVIKELVLPVIGNQNRLSFLEAEQELLMGKLKNARKRLEVLPTYETPEVQKISTELSSESTPKRKPHTFFIAHQINMGIPKGKAWINFKSLASESKGENQIEINDFGKIYLKRDRSDMEN